MSAELVVWIVRVLALAALAVACAPLLATRWTTRALPTPPGATYREPSARASDATAPKGRARALGLLFLIFGIVVIVAGPVAFLAAVVSSIQLLAPGHLDATPGVLLLGASIGTLFVGPALMLFSARTRGESPTVAPVMCAVLSFETLLLAAGTLAATFAPRAPLPAVFGASVVLLAGLSMAGTTLVGPKTPTREADRPLARRRLVGSFVFVAVFLSVATVLALGVADELGDRASNADAVPAAWLTQVQTWTFVLAGAFALGAAIDWLGALSLLLLRRRASDAA